MITRDPRIANYGRANYGQLAPNPTAKLAQQRNPGQGSPMMQALQPQAAPMQKPTPPQQPQKQLAATGTFGPKTFTQGLPTRGQTDFSANPHKLDGGMNMLKKMPGTTGALSPFGIGRRASGSQNDLSVDNAKQALGSAYQSILGRPGSDEEFMSHLQGQGLKSGDRWVGQPGLDAVINSLSQSPEFMARQEMGGKDTSQLDTAGLKNDLMSGNFTPRSPMSDSLSPEPAKSAYQEYLAEFEEGDPETPIPYEQFAEFFSQMPETPMTQSLWNPETREAVTNDQGRFGWNNINLNPVNQAGGSRFEGFNDDRALAGEDTKSIKDTFRRVVGGLGIDLSQYSSMADVENMLKTQVVPALQAAGVNVLDVQTDKILVETFERGPEWVDVVGDATGLDPRWWWGAEDGKSNVTPSTGQSIEQDFTSGERRSAPKEQGNLMGSLGFGGGDWQSLLDMLMQQVR
jgi:hypothetical protein